MNTPASIPRSIVTLGAFCGLFLIAHAQLPTSDSTSLSFVGAGNVQRSLDNGEGLPASTGLGVILDEYHIEKPLLGGNIYRVKFSGQINVANTEDTLRAEYSDTGANINQSTFGESILTPLVGRRAVNLDLKVFFTGERSGKKSKAGGVPKKGIADHGPSGFQIRYTGSNRVWADSTQAYKTTINALRFRLFHDFVNSDHNGDFNILLGFGWGFNSIRGDLALTANNTFRERILGDTMKMYHGLEAFAEFRIKNISAEFSYTWLDRQGKVPGISGSRMVTTIAFVGGFPVELK